MKRAPRIARTVPAAQVPLKPQRWRSKDHLAWIRTLRFCAATGRRMAVDPHHLMRWEDPDGRREVRGGRKWGDETVIPIGRDVHDRATLSGRPEDYLRAKYGILHRELAAALYRVSGDTDAGLRTLEKHLAEAKLRLKQDAIAKAASLMSRSKQV